jgi:undecaprenyl-diphosphatase
MKGKQSRLPEIKCSLRIILLFVFLFLFTVTAVLSLGGYLSAEENNILISLQKLRTPTLTAFMKAVTFMGNTYFLSGAAVLLLILPKVNKKFGLPAAITLVFSSALNYILKIIFMRERPDETFALITESGFSFPSGHMQGSTALFISIAIVLLLHYKKSKATVSAVTLCCIVPILVGISRMYLGVHFLSDILCGLALGSAAALSVSILTEPVRIAPVLIDPALIEPEKKSSPQR